MEKYKLKPIEYKKLQRNQTNRKETKSLPPTFTLICGSEIQLHLIPNLCKSSVLTQLSDSLNIITKWIKLQKPLTSKTKKYFNKY